MRFFVAGIIFPLHLAFACSLSAELNTVLEEAAAYYGLKPMLLHALVYQESRYCTEALSPKGAIGLGQLMPGTAAGLGVDPHDPVQNLYGAAAYLRQQWDTFENWELALAAYNAGPGAVIEYKGIPPYEETQNYVVSVLSRYTALLEELPEDTALVEVATTETPAEAEPARLESVLPPFISPEAAPNVTLAEGYEIEQPKPAMLIMVQQRPDLSKIPIMIRDNKDSSLTISNEGE
jgi:hypothetical protein